MTGTTTTTTSTGTQTSGLTQSIATVTIPVSSNTLEYTKSIDNLESGKQYKVVATANTNEGESKSNEKTITTKVNSVPKTIDESIVEVEFVENKANLIVSFKALTKPDDIGYLPIVKYTAYAKANSGEEFTGETTSVNNPSPILIKNVKATKATKYSVTVVATNALGSGEKTNDPSIFKFSSYVPEAPIITDVIKGNKQVTLEFTVPYSERPITGYVIKAYDGTDSSPTCVARKVFTETEYTKLLKGSTGRVTLTGLTNDISSSISSGKDLSNVKCSGESYSYVSLKSNKSSCFHVLLLLFAVLCIAFICFSIQKI
jgi:hypothetical protein